VGLRVGLLGAVEYVAEGITTVREPPGFLAGIEMLEGFQVDDMNDAEAQGLLLAAVRCCSMGSAVVVVDGPLVGRALVGYFTNGGGEDCCETVIVDFCEPVVGLLVLLLAYCSSKSLPETIWLVSGVSSMAAAVFELT
jgi:hypothetical protein